MLIRHLLSIATLPFIVTVVIPVWPMIAGLAAPPTSNAEQLSNLLTA